MLDWFAPAIIHLTRFFKLLLQYQSCKKASKKMPALARVTKCMDINKQRMFMKAFISSECSYCPLI